jgi:hypothetical protein
LPQVGGKSDQPEKERRLVAIDASVEMHENPIAPAHHLPGNLCVTGLIRIPEVPSAQIKKVKNKTDPDKKSNWSPLGRMIDEDRVSRGMKILSLF